MKDQLKELLAADYDIGLLWFDGEWEPAWTHERGEDLYDYLRALRPSLIINNRIDKGRTSLTGNTPDPTFKGDFGTPEQDIPATGFGTGTAWESCMTLNDTWGFKINDKNWKSAQTLIHNLIDAASKGGNYLLNVGPTGDGEIPAISLERLAAIGNWMKVNGESICGTTASLFAKASWNGRSTTRREDTGETCLYLHLFSRPEGGQLKVRGLWNRPEHLRILGQTDEPAVSGKPGAWVIQLPDIPLNPLATVVSFTFQGAAQLQPPITAPDASGVLRLEATDATLHGAKLVCAEDSITGWTDAADAVSWDVTLPVGRYAAALTGSCGTAGSELTLTLGAATEPFSFPSTGAWTNFRDVGAGELTVTDAGRTVIAVHAVSGTGIGFVNVRTLTLTKIP
jgi:alpha-L-fucosidase